MTNLFWKVVYTLRPSFLWFLEKTRLHNRRCRYHLGFLANQYTDSDLHDYLIKNGFENAILSLHDPGEILNLRKRIGEFQYHIRLFNDHEIRAHYDLTPEESPFGHILRRHLSPEEKFFKSLLQDYLRR